MGTLFALDERLGAIAGSAREPSLAAIKLLWWRDALAALDSGRTAGEPLIGAVATHLLPRISGAELADYEPGWRALLTEPPVTREMLELHAEERGGRLFAQAAVICGGDANDDTRAAGEAWALWQLAGATSGATADLARSMAAERQGRLASRRWPRALRSLGALSAVAPGGRSGPARVGRMLLHRITGL